MTFVRIQSAGRDVNDLVDPQRRQVSYHWSEDESMDRPGVSVCASVEDLVHYLAASGIPYGAGEWVVVELDGDRVVGVTPCDADAGELLIWPSEILDVRPMDDDFFDLIGAAYDAINA